MSMHPTRAELIRSQGALAPRPMGGFTLIELLVVVSIISLLVAILLPSLKNAREAALTSICGNKQKQIVNACFLYSEEHRGTAVPPEVYRLNGSGNSQMAYTQEHELDKLLGGQGQRAAFSRALFNEVWLCAVAHPKQLDAVQAGGGHDALSNTFSINRKLHWRYSNGVLSIDAQCRFSDVRRPSRALLFAENSPGDTWIDPLRFAGVRGFRGHFDGGNHSFMDGHVAHLTSEHDLYDLTTNVKWFWFETN